MKSALAMLTTISVVLKSLLVQRLIAIGIIGLYNNIILSAVVLHPPVLTLLSNRFYVSV